MTISLGASELADAEQVSLTKLARDIKVPGFRKGKVPASVAAKHVDPNALQEQILENALSKAVAEAFLQEKLQALDRPSVEVKKFVPGTELEFTAEVEIIPPVKLGDYKKLKAKKEVAKIEDKEIDNSKKEYHITPKGMEVLEKNLKLRQFLLDVAKKFIGGGSDE